MASSARPHSFIRSGASTALVRSSLSSRLPKNGPGPSSLGRVHRRSSGGVLLVYAAKGKNSKLAGRNKKAQAREDKKMVDGQVAAAKQRREAKEAVKKDPTLKYSKRGVVSSQPGQVSKAALKRIREAKENDAVSEERAEEKRMEYRKASAQGIPEAVTNRMLKRIAIFSGVPLLLGFSTGPVFYGLKIVAHVDVAPWQFFFASTATFGAALLGITYGVMSSSWEPGREGSFWGVTEFKANIPILVATVMGKAKGEDGSTTPDEWDDGL